MAKKRLSDIDVSGKRALVRVDFNVPLSEGQEITDDTRIRAAVPTIQYLLEGGASVVLMSHLGRPKGRVVPEMSLAPTSVRLGELLGIEVGLAPDSVGSIVEERAAALEPGQVLLLENLRYKPEEEANDPDFSKALAGLGDLYVNDAFGAAHRGHASTEGIAHHVPEAVSGLLMEREITYLDETLRQPARPFVAVLGGAKISGKIEVIENLLDKVDALIVGGGMSYTFFKAMGLEIGVSLLEEDRIGVARDLIARCGEQDVELLLPVDVVVADPDFDSFDDGAVPLSSPGGLDGCPTRTHPRVVFEPPLGLLDAHTQLFVDRRRRTRTSESHHQTDPEERNSQPTEARAMHLSCALHPPFRLL